MGRIELDKPTRDRLARDLAGYLQAEFGLEAGGMEALMFLDFLSERLGPHYYNQALQDAQAALQAKVDQIAEAIDGLERPVKV